MREGRGLDGSGAEVSRALYAKLVPRPNGLARERVAAHQRARLQGAAISAVAERGFGATTVRELAGLAGVSTRTFYERFTGKHECFLSACEVVVGRLARHVIAAFSHERDWWAAERAAFEAFTREIAQEPDAARAVLVEACAVGPAALAWKMYVDRLFEGMIAASFEGAPEGLLRLPPVLLKGIVAAMAHLARTSLLEDRAQELPRHAGELFEWAMSPSAPALRLLEDRSGARGCAPAGAAVSCGALCGSRGPEEERARILRAMAELTASKGYLHVTLPHVLERAAVLQPAFDRHFEDLEDCFVAVLEERCERVRRVVMAAAIGAEDWPLAVRRGVTAFTRTVARDPVFARLAFVEVFAAGPAGVRAKKRLLRCFADGLRELAPPAERPSRVQAEADVGAVWGIARHCVARNAAACLPALDGELTYLVLAPALGAEQAAEMVLGGGSRARQSALAEPSASVA